MTQQTTDTMTDGLTTTAPVVGLDVLSSSLRDADAVAHTLVRELHDLGAIDVVIASHVVQSGHDPHHVVTVSTDDLAPADMEDVVGHVGRNFLRPRWHRGQLVIPVRRSHGDAVVPFETPFATPCCPEHDRCRNPESRCFASDFMPFRY